MTQQGATGRRCGVCVDATIRGCAGRRTGLPAGPPRRASCFRSGVAPRSASRRRWGSPGRATARCADGSPTSRSSPRPPGWYDNGRARPIDPPRRRRRRPAGHGQCWPSLHRLRLPAGRDAAGRDPDRWDEARRARPDPDAGRAPGNALRPRRAGLGAAPGRDAAAVLRLAAPRRAVDREGERVASAWPADPRAGAGPLGGPGRRRRGPDRGPCTS